MSYNAWGYGCNQIIPIIFRIVRGIINSLRPIDADSVHARIDNVVTCSDYVFSLFRSNSLSE